MTRQRAGLGAVLGMNARNAHIARHNPERSIRLVDDKQATKDGSPRGNGRARPAHRGTHAHCPSPPEASSH